MMNTIELIENEKVIADGPACQTGEGFREEIQIYLTNYRLVIQYCEPNSNDQIKSFTLDKVGDVQLNKRLIFINRGLKMNLDGVNYTIELDFAKDWKSLIEYHRHKYSNQILLSAD